jgi:iron complex outermembrane receptor protein
MIGARSLMIAGISVLALTAAPAWAQDQAPKGASTGATADSAPADTGGIAEIVVTAQKKAERLQDVPISIAAVSGQLVANLHAATLQGLTGAVPNVQIGNFSNTPNTAVFTIRGIGVIEPDPYAGNTVGIVVDGVPQFFSMGALVDLYDVERIEVLRGPQGTLFGANTTGGVVNVVNTQPKMDEFSARADMSYGNYNHFQAGAAVNLPIAQNLAARFIISTDQRDGWVTNVINGQDMGKRNVTIYRGLVRWEPSSDIDVTLSGEYDAARNGAPIVVAGDVPGEAEYVPAGFQNMYASPCMPAGSRCVAPSQYLSARNLGPIDPATGLVVDPTKDESNMDTYRGTLTVNIRHTAVGDITSITGYKWFHLFEYTDQDGTPVFLDDTRRRTEGWQFSQELRSNVNIGDRLNVLYGVYYLDDHYNHEQDFRINFAGGVTYNPDGTVTYGLPGLFQRNLQDQDNYSISGFVQSYFNITDKLRLQAGIRYSHEKTDMLASTLTSLSTAGVTTFDGTAPNGTPNTFISDAAPPEGKKSWDNVGWKLGVDYKLTRDLMFYAYWARGFKSGGFTGRIGIPQDIGPYRPEHVDTFEMGMKSEWLDRHLQANLTGFYTNYRDMQLAQIYFVGSGTNLTQGNTILNVASSHIYGLEAEAIASPVRGLTLNASLAYLSAKYAHFPYTLPSGGILDLSGQRLQNAPKWTSSVSASYEFPVGNMSGRLFVQYNYTSDKLYSSIIDTPRATVQPTHIVNANADLKVNTHMTVGLWGTNLFDERYIASVFDVPGTLGLVNYAPPRQYGVSAKFEF